MKKLKILLVTSMPWRDDNNIGNSYSNLFADIEEFEIAHVYCRDGKPFNKKVKKYYQITEGRLAKSIFNPLIKSGVSFEMDASNETPSLAPAYFKKASMLRWEFLFIVRDLIWKLGKWNTNELHEFVEDFKPDLIFSTLTFMPNINNMVVGLKEQYNVPLVIYSWDDVYSTNHHSYNPLFWLRKYYQRKAIRKAMSASDLFYVISKEMQTEYEGYFHKKGKLLYKSFDFSVKPTYKEKLNTPVSIVFMGNIGAGRWKTLAELALAIKDINENGAKAFLNIYTLSPISDEMRSKLNVEGASQLNDAVAQELVMKTQQDADILVHVEPLSAREASFYRLSFSTKLVDYLKNARCILGIGAKTATLSYIEDNEAGVVAYNRDEMKEKLLSLLNNPQAIIDFGKKSFECGKRNHQREMIKTMLVNDMKSLIVAKPQDA